jgi:AraC-like DNA-binding protein
MLSAATYTPTVRVAPSAPAELPHVDTRRLRLRDFAHTRLDLDAEVLIRPGKLAGATTLLVVHAGEVFLHGPDPAAPLRLGEGEVVLLGRAAAWALSLGESASLPRELEVGHAAPLVPRAPVLRARGPGAHAEVSLIGLGFEDESALDLLGCLPDVLCASASPGAPTGFAALLSGVDGHDPSVFAEATIFARTLEIVVLDLLRRLPASTWRSAAGTPAIRKALELMRDQLSSPWRVATLAAKVGLSRSAFAARFTVEVGEPPLHHLAKLRLRAAAARLLQRTDEPIKSIASGVGYESMPSFCKAFRLLFGVAPGAYRAHGAGVRQIQG